MDSRWLRDEQDADLPRAIRRRWFRIVAVSMIFAGLAGIYGYTQTKSYTSTAKVLLRPLVGNPFSPAAVTTLQQITLAMSSEAALVNSLPVVQILSKDLRENILAGTATIRAAVVTNTQIVALTYRGATAAKARVGAETTARAFLEYRSNQATRTVASELKSVKKLTQAAQTNLQVADLTLHKLNPPADAQTRVALYASQLAALQQSTGELKATDIDPGTLATPATPPVSTGGLPPWLYAAVAGLVGCGASVLLVLWKARTSGFVDAATLTMIRGRPLLAVLPPVGYQLINVGGAAAELQGAYVCARTAILSGTPRGSVLVVSNIPCDELDAHVAANLGVALERAGFKVIVIDARLDAPPVANHPGAGVKPSLSPILGDFASHGSACERGVTLVQANDNDGLLRERLLTTRPTPSGRMSLVAGATFRNLIRDLRSTSDYVVVAAPPASSPDGLAVALAGDSLVLTAVDGQTSRAEAHDVLDRAARLGINVAGLIVVTHKSSRRSRRKKKRAALVLSTTEKKKGSGEGSVTAQSDSGSSPEAGLSTTGGSGL